MRWQIERMYFAAEKVTVVGAILFLVGAIAPLLRDPNHENMSVQTSDSLALILQLAVYAGAVIFMFPNRWRIVRAFTRSPVLFSLILLVLISTSWSAVPFFSIRRAIALLMWAVFGFYFGTRFKVNEQIRLVAYAMAISVLLSVVFIIIFPSYGTDAKYLGAWRGVFIHKSEFGVYMVIAAITFICFRAKNLLELLMKYICLSLCVCLLIGSKATGSWVVMTLAICLVFAYRLLHIHWRRLIPAAITISATLGVVAIGVALNAEAILKVLGKNESLTGRIPLWITLLSMSSSHSLLGYGYAAFWATKSEIVWRAVSWTPHKAHNGFVAVLLDFGVVGLGIFVLNTAGTFWRCAKLVARERTIQARWPLLMLSVLLIYCVFEMDPMESTSFFWVSYVAITALAQRYVRAERSVVQRASTLSELDVHRAVPCPQ